MTPSKNNPVKEEIIEWINKNYRRNAQPLYAWIDVADLLAFLKTLDELSTPKTTAPDAWEDGEKRTAEDVAVEMEVHIGWHKEIYDAKWLRNEIESLLAQARADTVAEVLAVVKAVSADNIDGQDLSKRMWVYNEWDLAQEISRLVDREENHG